MVHDLSSGNMITGLFIFGTLALESQPTIPWGGTDFIQYYATARLLEQGQNPYDLALSSEIQTHLGRDSGLPTYGPPWCLLPAYLLGYLPFRQAVTVNLGINVTLLLICTLGWTNLLFPGKKWLLLLITVAVPIWLPIWLVFGLGQNSLWPLAGFTGWLCVTVHTSGESRTNTRNQLLAGACLILLVVKPHLGLLLGLFAAAFMLQQRQWWSILGFVLTLVLATLVTLLIRPSVWSDYLSALGIGPPPLQFYGATLDGWLRFQGGNELRYLTWTIWLIGLLAAVVIGFKIPSPFETYTTRSQGVPPLVHAAALLCIATLAFVPHAYSYDYVFMIPGFILALGSWIIWKERPMFVALIGWLLLVVFYSTGKSRVLQEQNYFIIPWSALALMMAFSPVKVLTRSGECAEPRANSSASSG